MLVIERYYLRTYGGGFTENFYGLKRERVLRVKGGDLPRTQLVAPTQLREALKLSNGDVWKNVAVMVGIPYIKRKLDEAYGIHAPQAALLGPSYRRDVLPPDATLRQRLLFYYKWFIKNIYPSINAAYYFSLLAFNLAYLFSNTVYSSPLLWLIQTRIRRLSAADHHAIALTTEAPPKAPRTPAVRPGQSNSIFHPSVLAYSILPRILSSLRLVLPASIFALKFLEWWHASDFARQLSRKAAEGLDLPPPVIAGLPAKPLQEPSSVEKTANSVSLGYPPGTTSAPPPASTTLSMKPKIRPPISSHSHLPILTVPAPTPATSDLCPICLDPIVTPTASQTGHVFCYTCIFKWVDGSHDRQIAWMEGAGGGEGWGEDHDSQAGEANNSQADGDSNEPKTNNINVSREGKWESGKGRCAVTGRRLLGGVDGLRRIIV